ncbi:MAG: hypothetical protein Q8K63_05750 [Acidimicrobiales bacterium]|nr:hypothetical protein [Acidimicrobiales bacterium]
MTHRPTGPTSDPGVIIVDAPNVDAVTASILGRRPTRHERFHPAALADWARTTADGHIDTTLFTNIWEPTPPAVIGWINALVETGWEVFAKPKQSLTDDVDSDMVAHLASQPWSSVTVFSHDAECFAEPLAGLARGGIPVRAVGFTECAGRLTYTPGVEYVDAETIPGLYTCRLPRTRLDALPASGGWLKKVAV